MKTIITIQHTQSVHHTNGMVGSWTDWELSELGVICEMWVTKERVARNVQNERPVFLKGIDCHDHVGSPVRFAISTHLQRYKYLPVQQLNYQSY